MVKLTRTLRNIYSLYSRYLFWKDLPASNKKTYLRKLKRYPCALPVGKSRFIQLKHVYKDLRETIQLNYRILKRHFKASDGHLFFTLNRLQRFYLKAKHHMQRNPAQPLVF